MTDLTTPRLRLRQWRAADLEHFAALNADPVVMEFMPRCLTRAESDELSARFQHLQGLFQGLLAQAVQHDVIVAQDFRQFANIDAGDEVRRVFTARRIHSHVQWTVDAI